MRKVQLWHVAVGLLLAGTAAFTMQAPPAMAPVSLEPQALGTFLSQEVAGQHLVGLSLAVMRDGRIVYAGGAGKASIDAGTPVTADTRFAIGSITKQFTSTCILLLAEDGKLAVTDKVAKWFPQLTKAGEVTVLDLMNHVSGYPDYYPLDFVDRPMQKPIAVDDLINRFGTRPLDFPPGSRYSYSNTGFEILGAIVSRASGESYASFLDRRVLKPLGLTHTVFEPKPSRGPGFADGYVTWALGPPELAVPEGPGWVSSAGALYSTPTDLVTWDLALIDGKILKPESFKLMTSPRKLTDGTMSNYGCGLAIGKRGDQPVLAHSGAVAGFYAQNTMFPATKSAVVLLSNFDAYEAVDTVYARVLNSLVPPVQPAAKPAPAVAKKPPAESVPTIAGPPAAEAARLLFLELQKGQVARARLGDEYNAYLTDEKIRAASARLTPFGAPVEVKLDSANERGGMEVARTTLVFAKGTLKGLMYRTPDGKVQQFFVQKD
jgi:CubicO group peptidase (beta-lactamase class C family)